MKPEAVVLVSGGLDSTTLAYLLAPSYRLVLLSVDYGQRHAKEMSFARATAERLGAPYYRVDLTSVTRHLKSSALVVGSEDQIPHGHYAEESMKQTIVPNRNAIMLAVAFAVAAGRKAKAVATAVHAGDHFIYPDCRPEFIGAFAAMQRAALSGVAEVGLMAPFLEMTKAQIAKEAARLEVPIAETWSCYEGGEIHCGRCGTCVERIQAFDEAGVNDPTIYQDPDYALTVVTP